MNEAVDYLCSEEVMGESDASVALAFLQGEFVRFVARIVNVSNLSELGTDKLCSRHGCHLRGEPR